MKILLIDDEPFVLRLLARQLNTLGHTDLILCQSAVEAATAFQRKGFTADLVFCDLQMPGMDGIELIRHMANCGYTGGLVLVSGEDERILNAAEQLAQAHHLAVLGALRKPISSAQLRRIFETGNVSAAPKPAQKMYSPHELRKAMKQGELVNYYQPKVLLKDGELVGVETLVRWQHPHDGLVCPDQFIPVAEEHGLIHDLTRMVLHDSLRQLHQWSEANFNLHIAVNVSMENLTSLEFPEFVMQEAQAAGVPLTSLVLEITESRLMKDRLAAMDILTRLRLKHVGLSIDDFGTGHSSLAQLIDIPFDELKVDRGFVSGACHDASRQAILEASLAMASQLGMRTVAEGIETKEDWDFLRAMDCDTAQGYFIARPMPAEALPAWARAWEVRRSGLVSSAA